MEQQGEIVLYQPETTFKLEVRLENETVWLTQAQIAELFGTGRQAITKHLKISSTAMNWKKIQYVPFWN